MPFMLQDRVVEDAPPPSGPPAGLAAGAFAPEAALLVAPDRARVVLVHAEPDAMESQGREPVLQQQAQGFRAVALSLELPLADRDPQIGGAVRLIAHAEVADPDQPLAFSERDLEQVLLFPLVDLLQPRLFFQAVQRTEPHQVLVVLRVV